MTTPMRWEDAGDTAVRCAPWTIASVTVKGKERFELWHDKQPAMVGVFESAKLAAAEARRIEMAGQA